MQELLTDNLGKGIEPCSGAARQYDAFPHSDLKGQYVLSSAFVKQVLDGLRGE